MNSSSSEGKVLEDRMTNLTQQLNQMDAELDQQVADDIDASINEVADDIDASINEVADDIDAKNKEIKDELRQKVERIKTGIQDQKDELKQKVQIAKKTIKDKPYKEVESALNEMDKNLSEGDLVSAHINRWKANVWLKVAK